MHQGLGFAPRSVVSVETLFSRVACAAKNSQKNDGLYFEYERVDPDAAKEIPFEQGEALAVQLDGNNATKDFGHR